MNIGLLIKAAIATPDSMQELLRALRSHQAERVSKVSGYRPIATIVVLFWTMANSKNYRTQALGIRAEAIQVSDPQWRQKLVDIATLYDGLAVYVESRNQAHNTASR
jgi:hypothetical protein